MAAAAGDVVSGDMSPSPCPELLIGAPASAEVHAAFRDEGFAIAGAVLPPKLCEALIDRLSAMLGGTFDTGSRPDKVPTAQPRRPRVEQFVNAWKGDRLFEAVVQSPVLAGWVANIAGWPGAEVLQDQVWCKPPRSGPNAFHRDSAYMGDGVVTLWITLDDLEPNLGPLEYARGSHRWPPNRKAGFAPSLFGKKDWRLQMDEAAALCGEQPQLVQVLVPRGGGSIHDGHTWHGSAVNTSARPRRGLGIHFGNSANRPVPPTALARSMLEEERTVAAAAKDRSSEGMPETSRSAMEL
eukprot:gnl/TRDRNA2_/TRDRNA2_39836_c0_seq1.p1 gnl/TRDRNA2_/TRDRNA2_39836_c0~~gnl/TRDRNA2_/TRDRNA2_39836_c0_seq1.p1  ORF type:complete len:296 (+),score=47.73 gnl/TRDRNA2_/TRDRNA2_39836_c0_seq1:100-987(+)